MLVNGEVFRPVDAKGNEVQVFRVNGATYVPLRALAEAYGLEVGDMIAPETSPPPQALQRLLRRLPTSPWYERSRRSR